MKYILTLILSLTLAHNAFAQDAPTPPKSTGKLKIAAVVNDAMITTEDVNQRINMVIATTGLGNSPEVRQELAAQVIQALVDETLQITAAKQANILISKEEIDGAVRSIEQKRGKTAGSLLGYFASQGITPSTFTNQLKAQIAWRRFVQRRLASEATVTEQDVLQEVDYIKRTGSNIEEVLTSSIVLPIHSVETSEQMQKVALRITKELNNGADFQVLASQLSQMGVQNSAMSWADINRLEPAIAGALINLPEDGISRPVQSSKGYEIVKLHKRRTGKKLHDAEVLFKRIMLSLENNAGEQDVDILMDIARNVAKHPGPCTQKGIAGMKELDGLGINVDYTPTRYSQMSGEILPLVRHLKVGEISDPFAAPDGIHLLMLCERAELPFTDKDKNRVRQDLVSQKMELQALKHLRKMRREAYIDVRI